MKINVDINKKYQAFEGIGASGAWWAQLVGGWVHNDEASGMPVRDRIAQLLYSKEQGIGMTVYRYNIGGGSVHSGKGEYSQPLRATECFEVANGEYDWNRDENAVYMMKKSVEYGADEVILFVNSPIERLTKNGLAHNKKHQLFHENISRKNYGEFAKYCLDVTEHFVNEGVPVKYLSPVNEPIWVWNGGQEGCFYRPRSVRKVFEVFANELEKRRELKNVKLSGAESGDLRWFNKSYARQLLKNPKVRKHLDSVDVHSYFLLPEPIKYIPFLNKRLAYVKRFSKWMKKKYPDISIKMSEWTHMQGGRDYGMDSAIVTATVMQEDFTLLGATSWQHWIAVSEVDYCDGLIYINIPEKTFETTKRFYVTGNFTRYVEKGAVRVKAVSEDDDILLTAFEKENKISLVIVNKSENEKTIELPNCKNFVAAVTDKDNDLKEKAVSGNRLILSPRSVTTAVWEYEK